MRLMTRDLLRNFIIEKDGLLKNQGHAPTPIYPKRTPMEKKIRKTEQIRLNVYIQEHGLASRRKSDELIEAGLVRVNGKIVKTLGTKVDKTDEIMVDGKKLTRRPTKATYLFHKPYLTMTTRSDERSRPTIYDLPQLKKLPGNVQPVGRLDFKSEGLLILTNDGDLALALSHPKNLFRSFINSN